MTTSGGGAISDGRAAVWAGEGAVAGAVSAAMGGTAAACGASVRGIGTERGVVSLIVAGEGEAPGTLPLSSERHAMGTPMSRTRDTVSRPARCGPSSRQRRAVARPAGEWARGDGACSPPSKRCRAKAIAASRRAGEAGGGGGNACPVPVSMSSSPAIQPVPATRIAAFACGSARPAKAIAGTGARFHVGPPIVTAPASRVRAQSWPNAPSARIPRDSRTDLRRGRRWRCGAHRHKS